jgi:UDP-N-acetylmuramyl pentapeptide phosphotransferase/UDP-N-acetylglucosamine-1-phosphate transferase
VQLDHPLAAFWAAAIAAAVSFILLGWLLRSGLAWKLALDHPNERSLHERPTPRIGGIGIILGILACWGFLSAVPAVLLGCVLGLAAVSYADDRLGVPVPLRFAAHMGAAAIWALSLLPGGQPGVMLVLVLAIGWSINLYNFMDGSDGLAGGMAVIGFSSLAVVAMRTGHPGLAALCASVAAAAVGFLAYNFPPARLFMGDVGSVPLGFLAGAIGSLGWQQGAWPWWLPALVFAPFLLDASVTLGRRLVRGERVWQAHRDHYYQRLVRMGWSHRRTALAEYALMIGLGTVAAALVGANAHGQALGLAVVTCVLIALMVAVDSRWKRYQEHPGRP